MEIFVFIFNNTNNTLIESKKISCTTFLTSEKIKEILSQWKKVRFSDDSITSHQKSGPEIRQIACTQGFQLLKCSHALDQSLETV